MKKRADQIMKRIFLCLFIFVIIIFKIQSITLCSPPAPDNTLVNKKVESLETEINHLKDLLEKTRNDITRVYTLNTQSIDVVHSTIQTFLYFLGIFTGAILAGGFVGWIITLNGIKKYAREKSREIANNAANEAAIEAKKDVKEEVAKMVNDMLNKVENNLAELNITQSNLNKQFKIILQDLICAYHLFELFELQSSEDTQLKAVDYFIDNPANKPVIIEALVRLSHVENINLRLQSIHARCKCGDQSAIKELRSLTKDPKEEIRRAAKQVASTLEEFDI